MTIQQQAINTIRTLSIDAINQANSGHPGLPMGAAPMAYALWANALKHNPVHSKWIDRDRFVLSAGHGSMLLYSLLHLFNYQVSLDDLKQFRQLHSKTPGHPEVGHTDGVEATTGPLGQGLATAVGMAMAEKFLAAKFNKPGYSIVDHYTYTLVGDGCLQEGVSYEAMSMAGHLGLNKLIVLHDSNDISLDGELHLSFSENVKNRVESANWHYIRVEDGNDVDAITAALAEAKANTTQPSFIEIKTVIGYGSPSVAGSNKAHGAPLGREEAIATKRALGMPEDEFFVNDEVRAHYASLAEKGKNAENAWNELFASYQAAFPELAQEFQDAVNGDVSKAIAHPFTFEKDTSTRVASGDVINHFAKLVPTLFGGSADLSHSTMTDIKGEAKFAVESDTGRNIYFGIREFAMGAAGNGLALHGGVKPFVSTFFVFNDYLRPAIRLAALSKLPVTYVFTHDSIAVGEDGPTHEPVEHIAALRAIPGLTVLRPSDANETASAWAYALQSKDEPVALVLTRQNVPTLPETAGRLDLLQKGAYVLRDSENPQAVLIATGSEVGLALDAQAKLASEGVSVRVVAMPSHELFDRQDVAYKESVLPTGIKRLAIEMGISQGWEKYTGFEGSIMSVNTFGASGSGNQVLAHFGFTVDNVVNETKKLV